LNRSISAPDVSSGYVGFGISSSNRIQYYVTNWYKGEIYVFQEWSYLAKKSSFPYVNYMTQTDNLFYVTGLSSIWKTDEQMNVLIKYSSTGSIPDYRGLYYNRINRLIYVASYNLQLIHIFNLSLTLNDTISISPYKPCSINEYNNQLFVGTSVGRMLIIINSSIVKEFNGCNGQSVTLFSILFDEYYNIATACLNNQLYFYNRNGNYLNKNIPTISTPYYIGFDSKSRLVVVTNSQISLYN